MTEGRKMTARIPVTPETKDFLRQFVDGTGATYDDVLLYVLKDKYGIEPGDNTTDIVIAGAQLRDKLSKWKATRR